MQLVEKPAFDAVGIEVRAGWQELWQAMPAAWQRFMQRYTEIDTRRGDAMMDISLELNGDVYRQLVGVEVEADTAPPEGMVRVHVPAQRYLHFRHEGSLQEIAASFGKMYDWGKANGIELDEFKLDVGYTPAGDERPHDLYVRVAG